LVGVPAISELSGIYDVLKSRDYGVLEPLDEVVFVVTKPGKPIKYKGSSHRSG